MNPTAPLPSALNTDEQWAMLIAWLAERQLIVHIPMRDPVWFEPRKSAREVVETPVS